jgi:glutamine synthetase
VTKLNIEAETASSMARTMIVPAAARYIAELIAAQLPELAGEVEGTLSKMVDALKNLESVNLEENQPHGGEIMVHAEYIRDTVMPAMAAVREGADELERLVADDLWPLPKYSEILFIK